MNRVSPLIVARRCVFVARPNSVRSGVPCHTSAVAMTTKTSTTHVDLSFAWLFRKGPWPRAAINMKPMRGRPCARSSPPLLPPHPLYPKANPEQSKHLETARMKIMGVWVDLVNLRTEVYRCVRLRYTFLALLCVDGECTLGYGCTRTLRGTTLNGGRFLRLITYIKPRQVPLQSWWATLVARDQMALLLLLCIEREGDVPLM